jgi:bifunctional DNA-binding transcriptional regulator/antitoxin component of YhaV-PrlF toxin-antitoxin module
VVKLQFDLNKQYKLTLPKAIVEAKGWEKGDKIKVMLDSEGNIILKKDVIVTPKKSQKKTQNAGKRGASE